MNLNSHYSLERVVSSKDQKYIEGLSIYSRYTHPALRTETNTITYWLDNYNKKFDDEFHVLVFSNNEIVIGYTQLTYFVEENIVVIDYISIDERYRKNNTFFEFADQLAQYIESKFPSSSFSVVELALIDQPYHQSDNFELMKKLLGMIGFYELDLDYWQLELSASNHESKVPAHLFLNPRPLHCSLRKETALDLLHMLYIKHYSRWFEVYEEDKVILYKEKAQELYSTTKTSLVDDVYFKGGSDKAYESIVKTTTAQPTQHLGLSVKLTFLFLVLALSLVFFIKKAEIDKDDFFYFYGFLSVSFVFFLSLFSSRALEVLEVVSKTFSDILKGKP
ncbi:hypothetical protein CWC03_22450 [Pseudoalteromonas sp. S2755]|nr:hypothetical protein CWC03_22450 [Pseudoalteromonas sp. S2755]